MSDSQGGAWWAHARLLLAFCIAPLGSPATTVLLSTLRGWPAEALVSMAWVELLIGYGATLLVGVPLYWFLVARGLTAFWIAPVAGFVVGAMLSTGFYALVAFSLGHWPLREVGVARVLAGLVQTGGLGGASIGILFWLIARPDRQLPESPDDEPVSPDRHGSTGV